MPMIREHFTTFGGKLPMALGDELRELEQWLG